MKKTLLSIFLLMAVTVFAQQQTVTYSINPPTFEDTTPITITINGTSINESTWGVTGNALYLWSWSYDVNDTNQMDSPSNGSWTSSNEAAKFTYNAGTDTYTKTFTPSVYFGRNGIGRIGFLVKAKDGSGSKQSQDIVVEVGSFQVNLTSPVENSASIIASGSNFNIAATNTNGAASYSLKANGTVINTNASTASYSYSHINVTNNQTYELSVTQGSTTIVKKFSVVVNPNTVSQTMPAGLVDGINYNSNDTSKATLVLDAPLKDFVYVAGSFNNWQPTSAYAMKKDPVSGKFWLELTGLVSGVNNTYQYWVVDASPLTGSPSLVKTADPYSTLVLSPYDDPWIPASSYPNLPAYPAGQQFEVTVLKTGQTPYNWQVTNFTKPEKEKLVIYEVLVRDFDAARNYQSIIDKIDYFKNLKINAIELMPVMEFEGNESWGYNTSFHMALDKFYGTSDKLKELIDVCHQNGIAVILDVALNHAFGRNPMVRMWMNDPDGDGFGSPTAENPYFNTVAKHTFSVGEDFNHQSTRTQYYVERVIKQWIQEYKIDGFRWDLTKGFTQACTASDQSCTNAYQQDRVDILKKYADYSWSLDPTHYTIFEHLGTEAEEKQWADYRVTETPSKGVMMWGKMTDPYNQLSMGYASESNISKMSSANRGFAANRLIGYAESHDEERLMYKNVQYGASNSAYNVKTLNTALSRMSAIGAVSLLVPGPKMIWHFGELGWESSIFTCNDNSVNTDSDSTGGDCKLDTKPQPQWVNNWLGNSNRNKIYNDWAKMITLKKAEPVFLGTSTIPNSNSLTVNIKITNAGLTSAQLKDVLILANFDVTAQNVSTGFPYAGTWYNLMDNTTINVTDVNAPINLPAGEYRIYGNKTANLAIEDFEKGSTVNLYPNPVSNHFTLSTAVSKVQIYSVSGQFVKSFASNGNVDFQFGVSELQTGLYIVKASDENGKIQVMKFIKK
ncbi:alpha-amylase family glycosyl hydrolase [Flavobacterium johnsoniae]|uniref:Candidate alpha-glycosidase Glycoside hydrolase family 13 n=1 Tax=Flavobacterium johnsoniae (strain ATCC 17061 / DSM 2064 / JCM 8514 / BCRC 14874 / CCUG 350202 / NBRC 14942 / NCIMB 11054 / UW101) TaxID=376686 RepID=A5FK34_FLAJ1|nr:alpha-amylase family glycosyl hydrolase [Flavobacterium johnsoniae]ABQ04440.1 Candidate alpha-glycosidase; Glycoside hydrolase family 13 [Flavobacterium johnsoniae UW101]OXE97764.1 alpha-amylase [Flavobacterium johnsoniae UW101]WQG83766.1 alpha-amylase family glycosyl hydrolase [Flavobacterium johnsoniae UW101]SHK22469.1 Por secretion system C-terminal sorting domain-containing protein [Flavobacterium johnsoniae]